jgi:hypothetical protein
MELRGQLARVPVTARQKFEEAAYFYNQMFGLRTNVIRFPFYLSAFLSALRSVTMYLQKQYASDSRFAAWYPEKQRQMEADSVLKTLNAKRAAIVHREPFDLYFRKGYRMPQRYGNHVETTHFELIDEVTPEGFLMMSIRVGEDAPLETVEPWISWHFSSDDPADVMNHCYSGLQKMDGILRELTELRIGLGLPADEEINS